MEIPYLLATDQTESPDTTVYVELLAVLDAVEVAFLLTSDTDVLVVAEFVVDPDTANVCPG